MKSLTIIVLIAVCQCCKSNVSPLFNLMSAKIDQLKNKVVVAFKTMKNKIKRAMFSTEKSKSLVGNPNLHTEDLTKKHTVHLLPKETSKRESAAKIKTSSYEVISDPTTFMSAPQLATAHGQRIESHVVLTEDGYLITVHNLKSSINKYGSYYNLLPNCTILLHHGLLGSSADWILLGVDKSLPYILTSLNCDVWLTNARGNDYSRGHIRRNIDSKEFWNFSWTEMSKYDLPAVIDYIRKNKNNTEPISFIGHSMGTTVFLAMLSTLPKYNQYFRMAILLAPLVFMGDVKSPLCLLKPVAYNPPEYVLHLLGEGEFMPSKKIPALIARKYCKGPEMLCTNPLLFISSSVHDKDLLGKDLYSRILHHVPAGASTNTMLHYAQMIKSGKFQIFQNESQEFSLKNVTVPIAIFSSDGDSLAPSSDVLKLFSNISCPVDHHIIRDSDFKHTDFVWNPAAVNLVFEKVIDLLRVTPSC